MTDLSVVNPEVLDSDVIFDRLAANSWQATIENTAFGEILIDGLCPGESFHTLLGEEVTVPQGTHICLRFRNCTFEKLYVEAGDLNALILEDCTVAGRCSIYESKVTFIVLEGSTFNDSFHLECAPYDHVIFDPKHSAEKNRQQGAPPSPPEETEKRESIVQLDVAWATFNGPLWIDHDPYHIVTDIDNAQLVHWAAPRVRLNVERERGTRKNYDYSCPGFKM